MDGHAAHRADAGRELRMRLEALSNLGFIYRFNVARKFGYPEQKLMQLRLNSWGREAVRRWRLEGEPLFGRLVHYWSVVFEQRRAQYDELLRCCASPARPLDTKTIHQLNRDVPVPLVT